MAMGLKARVERYYIRPDLELRALQRSDAPAYFACVQRNRKYLRQWMPWLDLTMIESDVLGFLDASRADYATGRSYRLAMIVDGQLAGVAALEDIETMHRRAKIGYWLDASHQGRGLMTEAVRFLLANAFQTRELHLVELRAATANLRSRSVAERIGMRLDGVLRQREWLYNHYVDLAVYSMTDVEWWDLTRGSTND